MGRMCTEVRSFPSPSHLAALTLLQVVMHGMAIHAPQYTTLILPPLLDLPPELLRPG